MKVLAIRHVSREGAGTLEGFLDRKRIPLKYWDIVRDPGRVISIGDYAAYVILGGPMSVYEADRYPFINRELEFIEKLVDCRKPVLGICLGAQLLAKVLGAEVIKGPWREIGWYPVGFDREADHDLRFRFFAEGRGGSTQKRFFVFHWHGDTFDLPKGAVRLAYSSLYPNQAFRYEDHIYAIQFHMEITESMIHEWVRAELRDLDGAVSSIDFESIRNETPSHLGALQVQAETFYQAFFNMEN